MKKGMLRLSLKRETLRDLDRQRIGQVAGGVYTQYCDPTTATAACTHGGPSEAQYGCTQQT
jgi:hypothetical protein